MYTTPEFEKDFEETELIGAAREGNLPAIQALLKKADLDLHHQSYTCGTALVAAVFFNKPEAFNLLLDKEPKPFNASRHPGLLLTAIRSDQPEIVRTLLKKYDKEHRALVNQSGEENYKKPPYWFENDKEVTTPFDIQGPPVFELPVIVALQENRAEALKVLLEYNPDLDLKGKSGYSANELIQDLIKSGKLSEDITKVLINKGIIKEKQSIESQTTFFTSKSSSQSSQAVWALNSSPFSATITPSLSDTSPLAFREVIQGDVNSLTIIKGELLESFNEVLVSELEELADVEDEVREQLADVLNEDWPVETVVKYASEVDPFLGKRFAIIYCSVNPNKWDDSWMQAYKAVMIESYIERSRDQKSSSPHLLKEAQDKLKRYAKQIADTFIKENGILTFSSNSDEMQKKKEGILKKIANIPAQIEITSDVELLKSKTETLENLIKVEGEQKLNIVDMVKPSPRVALPPNVWRLKTSNEKWREIYNLINKTPTGHQRDENRMLEILRAILYKEEKQCRWSELPQSMPTAAVVAHYYFEWKNNGALSEIKEMLANENEHVPMPTRLN